MRVAIILLYLVIPLLFVAGGCAQMQGTRSGRSEIQFDADSLWRQGYGFNNPNPQRHREGKSTVNFDGSEPGRPNLIGKLIGAALVESVRSIGREIGNRWQRPSDRIGF